MAIVESITLKNFGVHRNRTFQFDKGFNVIRGANEAGKTTILEGIAICFFGNSALRGSWEDVVTTGEKVGSLSLDMRYGDLTVHRAKGSASVVSDDGKVQISGHTDVTEFFLRHFGIEKGTEKFIMLAKQGAIQGILDSGATDATQFIENLAGFDQIDVLVAKLKVKYPVVDAQALSQQISSLETKLADKQAEEVPNVAISKHTMMVAKADQEVAQEKVTRSGEVITKLGAQLEKFKEQKREFDATTTRLNSQTVLISDLKMNQTGIVSQVKTLEVEIGSSKSRLEGAQKFLGGLAQQQSLYQVYRQVVDFVGCEDTWDEDWQELLSEKIKLEKSVEEKRVLIAANNTLITRLESTSLTSEQLTKFEERRDKLKVELEVLKNLNGDGEEVLVIRKKLDENETQIVITKAKLVTEGVCPTCGTDLTHSHEEINAGINEELASLQEKENKLAAELVTALMVQKESRTQTEQALIKEQASVIIKLNGVIEALKVAQQKGIDKLVTINTDLLTQIEEATGTVAAMGEIITTQQAVESILVGSGVAKIKVDKAVYPWTMAWADDIPVEPTQQQISKANNDLVYCQGLVTQLKSKKEEYDKVCKQIAGAEGLLVTLQKELLTRTDTTGDITKCLELLENNKANQVVLSEDLAAKTSTTTAAVTKLALDEQAVKNRDAAIAEIQAEIQGVLKQIQLSAENNALHRAVADARIKVIEGVWNTLLTAANDCFSAIRGTQSEIVREGKAFKVNGIKTIRLSGSTLDSLGLAMRAAIRDVFAPNTEFMLLDEAAAGADADRTAAMMAQIASLSTEQTILVTHEEVSGTLANHIIEV